MLANILYALLGAAFGAVISVLPRAHTGARGWRLKRHLEKRRFIAASGTINQWLIQYYEQHNETLYYADINGQSKYISVLYRHELLFSKILDPRSDWPLKVEPERSQPFRIDEKVLDTRRELGAVLFRSWRKSMYLDSIDIGGGEPEFLVRPCEYFEIATALINLEEETFKAVLRKRLRTGGRIAKTPFRDTHLRTLPLEGHRQPHPLSIGSNTVLAIKTGEDYQIAIQTRAETVITSPNAKAVIPNFGFEPNVFGAVKSSYGIVYYNFIREYLEELFDYEEIIGRSKWAQNPDWFLRLPEAKTLLKAISNGRLSLVYLGAGIECLSGTTTMALLAVVDDPEVISELSQQLSPNYEVAKPSTSQIPVEFIGISDSRLGIWHEQGRFQASTGFALALALKFLREESIPESM